MEHPGSQSPTTRRTGVTHSPGSRVRKHSDPGKFTAKLQLLLSYNQKLFGHDSLGLLECCISLGENVNNSLGLLVCSYHPFPTSYTYL